MSWFHSKLQLCRKYVERFWQLNFWQAFEQERLL